ncbi:MAG TPA: hypothetical protein VF796_29740, partial [Humisphaera sp.]
MKRQDGRRVVVVGSRARSARPAAGPALPVEALEGRTLLSGTTSLAPQLFPSFPTIPPIVIGPIDPIVPDIAVS